MSIEITDVMVCCAYIEAKRRRMALEPMPMDVHPYTGEITHIRRGRYRWMPYDILTEWSRQDYDACEKAMEQCYRRGFISVGLELRWGWVSDKGEALLARQVKRLKFYRGYHG